MRFRGEYSFLSNFYTCKVVVWGIEFTTSEHAFVAAKTLDINLRRKIAQISTPGQAKRFGRTFELRSDWEGIRVSMMEDILRHKFEEPTLRARLVQVEGEIIEHNQWHDNFWGVCTCGRCRPGKNTLGKILMALRDEIELSKPLGAVGGLDG